MSTCPRIAMEVPLAGWVSKSIHDTIDIAAYSSEVAPLHRTVDIDDAAHVVLGDDCQFVSSMNRCHIGQDLRVFVAGISIGIFSRSWMDSILYCGVCAAI